VDIWYLHQDCQLIKFSFKWYINAIAECYQRIPSNGELITPKRKVKEDKPRRKMTRTHIILPPVIVGIATLGGFVIMHFLPAPSPLNVCLKAHDVDTFNVHSRIEIDVDGKRKLLPGNVGLQEKQGKECLHVIHTDEIGNVIHIQFVRPIRLTMDDFMKVYAPDNKTITVVDNSTGKPIFENLTLSAYDVNYSYFSTAGYTPITNLTQSPPFTDTFSAKISIRSR
jgi:hypothetical protein